MNRIGLLLLGLAATTVVGGCNLAPEYQRPEAPIPTTWPTGPAYEDAPDPAAPVATEVPWQDFLTDPRLREVIRTALDNNRDLRVAALNVERARAFYRIQRSELFPTIDAAATGNRQRVPADLSPTGRRSTLEQYSVDLGLAAWEIDLFGRLRSLEQAALEEFFATWQARHSVQILLVSAVADAYLTLAADRENLALARTTLEGQQAALDLVQRRFDRGATPELDVHRARTQVEVARGAVALFTQRVAQDINALTLLAGAPVPAELLPADLADVIPFQDISAGVPSEVLLSRPDILQAEHRLRAAYANIGAARAAFFPRISLTSVAGTASSELSGLFNSGSGTWGFSPQVSVPIFDPRTWAAADVSRVEQRIALAQYELAIQTSFREVADALAVRGTVDEQVAAQEALVQAMAETYRLSNIRYERGVDSYLAVLDAQRALYAAQQDLVDLRLVKVANQVRLYAVLGGGWSEPAEAGEEEPTEGNGAKEALLLRRGEPAASAPGAAAAQ